MPDEDLVDLIPIFPGDGGLDQQRNPYLVSDGRASDVENVTFAGRAIENEGGWEKLYRDLPLCSSLRFSPRPVFQASRSTQVDLCPWVVFPYHAGKEPHTGDPYQIDISFRVNRMRGESLSGADRSGSDLDAPAGGEFQSQTLMQRGGSDVEPLRWWLGLVIINPTGYDPAGQNPAPELARLAFYWWHTASSSWRFSLADQLIMPGFTYHASLQIDESAPGTSRFVINGVAVGLVGDTLPQTSDLEYAKKSAWYVARPVARSSGVGNVAGARMRGVHGLTSSGTGTTTRIDTADEIPGASSMAGLFVRAIGGNNAGKIRRVTSVTGAGPYAVNFAAGEAWPSPWNTASEEFEIILPREDCPQDVSIGEVRVWRERVLLPVINQLLGRQLANDIQATDVTRNYGLTVGAPMEDLIAYWPMDDDGGGVVRDLGPYKIDGWFSSWPGPDRTREGVFLDGRSMSVQFDLAEEPALRESWHYALGASGAYRIFFQLEFQLCRELVDIGAATLQDEVYETIVEWDDPKGEDPAPIFALRWCVRAGTPTFYLVWHTGSTTVYTAIPSAIAADPKTSYATGLRPSVGRNYQMICGIQQNDDEGQGHRYYVMITDGTRTAKGYSNLITNVASEADLDKTRISIGASVVGEAAKGERRNCCLMRLFRAGWSLRPAITTRDGAALNEARLNNWTSGDRIEVTDAIPELAADAALFEFEQGSRAVSSASGEPFSRDRDSSPNGAVLVVPAYSQFRKREFEPTLRRPRFILLDTIGEPPSSATMALPWEDADGSAEVRMAGHLAQTAFRTDLQHVNIDSGVREGEAWALTPVWRDRGALSLGDVLWWHLAVLPAAAGTPQTLFQPRWGDGLVRGHHPIRGVGQWKGSRRGRHELAVMQGSLFRVDPRIVEDHPRYGQPKPGGGYYRYSLEARTISLPVAAARELAQPERLPLSRRTDPLEAEALEIPDGVSTRLWIPNDIVGEEAYIRIGGWIKLFDIGGRRTIVSRVGTHLGAPAGSQIFEEVNLHLYLEDGSPAFEIRDDENGRQFLLEAAENDKARMREIVRTAEHEPGRGWVKIVAEIHLASEAAFGTNHAFYINDTILRDTQSTILGGMTPAQIPDPPVTKAFAMVYGQDTAGQLTNWRWGLGGLLASLEGVQSTQPGNETRDTLPAQVPQPPPI